MLDAVVASAGPLARVDALRGVVHAVFPTSVYVEPSDGPFLVIHDQAHGHTPTSLIVHGARPAEWGAVPGDAVVGLRGYLRIGAMVLDVRRVRAWRPRPVARHVRTVTVEPLATLVCATTSDAFERISPDCLRLAAALAAGDADAVAACARVLVGNGPGLTPSGDDALVGLLAVLHRSGSDAIAVSARTLLGACIRPLLGRTTTISAHYLRLAFDGHFGEHLTNLLDARGSGVDVLADLVARVRDTGATSGADALVGVVSGLRLLGELSSMQQAKEWA